MPEFVQEKSKKTNCHTTLTKQLMKCLEEKLDPKQLLRILQLFPLLFFLLLSGIIGFGLNSILRNAHLSEAEHNAVIISNALFKDKGRDILTLLAPSTTHKSPPSNHSKKMPDSQLYSIQAGSFSMRDGAIKRYNEVLAALAKNHNEYSLRVEKIGTYHTVRIGSFSDRSAAERALNKMPTLPGGTVITQANIKNDRIIQSNVTLVDTSPAEVNLDPRLTDIYMNIDQHFLTTLEETDITDITVFSADGIIVYSTDISIISQNDSKNPHLQDALSGNVSSSFLQKNKLQDRSAKQINNQSVVETYVPIKNANTEIVGAYQLKRDNTRYHRDVKKRLITFFLLVSAFTLTAFGFFILMIRPKTQQLREIQESLLELSATDSLTGLLDRRQFLKQLENEFKRLHKETGRKEDIKSIGCVIAEIDHLKKLNDQYGYQTGDKILQFVSKQIIDTLRPYDVAGRYGGEEFIIMLPNTSLSDTQKAAERFCSHIRTIKLDFIEGEPTVTVSMGVSCLTEYDTSVDDAIKRAGASLDNAKESGRNRVCWDEALEV